MAKETDNKNPKTAPTSDFDKEYKDLADKSKEIEVARQLLIEKAVHGDNPTDIVKAMNVVKIQHNSSTDDRKSTFVDPFAFDSTFGYKAIPNKITYATLYSMSKTPIINAIIQTRKAQVAAFSEPQKDRYSSGFIIRKKGFYGNIDTEISKHDQQRINDLTEFMLNTGVSHSWSRNNFDQFLRMFVEDSLIYDQACFEVVRDKSGAVHEFLMTDGTTMRVADSFSDSDYRGRQRQEVGGYYPNYVQVIDSKTYAEFYPWEMCFGIRNPSSRLHSNGYGRSELEDMVTLVTSMLWSDQYNRNFFRQGAAPKGILRMKGGTNNAQLQEFRQQWKAMVAGVDNAWRTPVIDSESMEWIDLQKGHKDMEYGKWQEYLVKLSCALYTIDPTEIGFPTGGQGSGGGSMFESDQSKRIKYSQDKGLKPLLKFIQAQINKYIVSQIAPDLTFEFVGLDAETEKEYRDRIKDEVTNYKTINEVRKSEGLQDLEGGDVILNPTFAQMKQMEQQEAMMAQQEAEMGGGEEGEEGGYQGDMGDDFAMQAQGGEEGEEGEGEETEKSYRFVDHDNNPFAREFMKAIEDLEQGKL